MIIPARNSQSLIARTVRAVLAQATEGVDIEVIVVDDGSDDDTAGVARAAGARTVVSVPREVSGNPAAARNRGAAASTGDPIIFLDADCTPEPDWLERLLTAHTAGEVCVGGSLALALKLPASARLDYYAGWYHVHPSRRAGIVSNHPPCNVSVRRSVFLQSCGFSERQPLAYAHEELEWQAEIQKGGARIYFEPKAIVAHENRPGFGNLLRRSYRWGYSSIESKAETGAARWAWLYRHPRVLILAAFPLAFAQTAYITACWVRAGVYEPVLMLPGLLTTRLAYAAGMTIGGLRWLRRRSTGAPGKAPRWA